MWLSDCRKADKVSFGSPGDLTDFESTKVSAKGGRKLGTLPNKER